MKLILDVCIGSIAEQIIVKNLDHDILLIRDIDSRMEDAEIMELANSQQRIIVTIDKDFGELVYHYQKSHCGILLLRVEDLNSIEKAKLICDLIERFGTQLENKFCVFQNGFLRIK